MADLTAWDTRRYLALLRQQAEELRADPSVQHVRFKPDELAAETLSRAADPNTPPCTSQNERDRLAWLLRLERDVLYGLCDSQNARTATWNGQQRDAALRSVGQALLNSTAVWDAALNKEKERTTTYQDDSPEPFDKYEDFKLVSQGGMGVVYRCRDKELGRVVAMKIMHRHLLGDAAHMQDFREEAQVASQLQHPNVAPVHERGKTPDGRPYFTMKLIQGKTWSEAISQHHADPSQKSLDLLLRQFVAVCDTIAFAHKKDVLHRDLKPLNVMVGPFGEVQVMDWGLAKFVRADGREESASAIRIPQGPETVAGSVRGTFAYMSPEQADPKAAKIDRRTDVFSLGSILCEILTGRPAYTSNAVDREERSKDMWAQARDGKTAAALQRLEMSEAPKELIRLATRCIAVDPNERPETADVLATIVNRYFEKRSEDERSGEILEATVGERRKKRGWQVALGLSIAAAALLGMGGYLWYYQKTRSRIDTVVQEVKSALEKSAELQKQAAAMPTDTPAQAEAALVVWKQALAAAETAESLLKPETSEEHRAEVEAAVAATRERVKFAEAQVALAKQNQKLLGDLKSAERQAAIRLVGFRADGESSRKAFAKAFRDYGVDLTVGDPDPAAEKLKRVPQSQRGELARGLDFWASIDKPMRQKLRKVADPLDGNSWRREFRKAVDTSDDAALTELSKNAQEAVNANEADLMGDMLRYRERADDSMRFLQEAERTKPGEYWVQMSLGASYCAVKPAQYIAAAECYKTAKGLEPNSAAAANNYGLTLLRTGETDRGLAAMKDAVALQETSPALHCNLAMAYNSKQLGSPDAEREANRAHELDAKFQEAIAVQALCKLLRGDKKGCEERLSQLTEEHQETTTPLFCRMLLSIASIPAKERSAADYARRVVKVDPRSEIGLFSRVIAEVLDGDTEAAESAANQLINECPYGVWEILGRTIHGEVLIYQGRIVEAESEITSALKRRDFPTAHDAMFKIRLRQGRFDEAAKEMKAFQEAIKDVSLLSALHHINQFMLEGATKVEAHTEAAATGKEPLKETFRSLVAETALLKGRAQFSRKTYAPLVIVSNKLGLEYLAAHSFSVVTSYEGVTNCTNAARAGVRVGANLGSDVDGLTPAERAAARQEALDLLKSDLEFKSKIFTGPLRVALTKFMPSMVEQILSRERFKRWLIYCLRCDDFSPVREKENLAKLPEKERKDWEKFWADMETTKRNLPAPTPLPKAKTKGK